MKKFIVRISKGWDVLKFEFSKQEEACQFMGEAVVTSAEPVKCTLELEDITDEEKKSFNI